MPSKQKPRHFRNQVAADCGMMNVPAVLEFWIWYRWECISEGEVGVRLFGDRRKA
jgi:hypothetical protein